MKTAKVAISINKKTLKRLDHLVRKQVFPSRSRAIQFASPDRLPMLSVAPGSVLGTGCCQS